MAYSRPAVYGRLFDDGERVSKFSRQNWHGQYLSLKNTEIFINSESSLFWVVKILKYVHCSSCKSFKVAKKWKHGDVVHLCTKARLFFVDSYRKVRVPSRVPYRPRAVSLFGEIWWEQCTRAGAAKPRGARNEGGSPRRKKSPKNDLEWLAALA